MARVRLTEYAAKTILKQAGLLPSWTGVLATSQTSAATITSVCGATTKLVVKVDQGVKQRGKKGLLKVGVTAPEALAFIKTLPAYTQFLTEPLVPHTPAQESYLSLERVREGYRVLFSPQGGIEVEEAWDQVQTTIISRQAVQTQEAKSLRSLPTAIAPLIFPLIKVMNEYDWAFVEINPLVVTADGAVHILDCAVLVDDVSPQILRDPEMQSGIVQDTSRHEAEVTVKKLQKNTPASLKLSILNPHGSIWMLLSGGGASIVLADEVADLGLGKELANYGEYSGNPTREDVTAYTDAVIQAMIASQAKRKVLVIAGGVANFTDIRQTLLGVIDGLEKHIVDLKSQHISVYVRRAGPNQTAGLTYIRDFLHSHGVTHEVSDASLPLTTVIHRAITTITS